MISMSSSSALAASTNVIPPAPMPDDPRFYVPPDYTVISDPLSNPDIQQLLNEGTLTYEDLGVSDPDSPTPPPHDPHRPPAPNDFADPGTAALIVAEGSTVEVLGPITLVLIVITLVAASKENPTTKTVQVKKVVGKVAKVTGPVVGPWVGCVLDYWKEWTPDTHPRGCGKVLGEFMANAGFNENDADAANNHFGTMVDRFLLRSRRLVEMHYGHTVFETTVGQPRITYFPVGDYAGLIKGGYDRVLDVAPTLMPPGRLMMPLRAFEAGGSFKVDYFPKDGKTQRVTLTRARDGQTITYTIGSTDAHMSNGTSLQLDVPPMIVEGRTMLPFRASFTPFCTVDWLPYIKTAVANCVP
ncbi:MAG TPA: copper amine oxidase N-terminal domain-containing protein [Symbiobacteriaceae bacterium]